MTDLHRFGWAFSLIIVVALTIFLVALVATSANAQVTPDPDCDPALETEVAAWDVLYEPCAPSWARDVAQVQAVYDAGAQDVLSSLRVMVAVGFGVLAIPLYALVFLNVGRS